jgi:hypothetical protein
MRRTVSKGMMAWVVAAGLVASAMGQDYAQTLDEEKVAFDQVPGDAAKGAKFTRAFVDKAKNYRLVGKGAEGALVVVQATEEGKLVAVETRTAASAKSVPRVVNKALDAERRKNPVLRGFQPRSVEEADVFTAAKGKLDHLFQFRGVNGEGDPMQVDVTPEGKVVSARVVALHPDAVGGGAGAAEAKEGQLPPEVADAVMQAVPGMRIQGSKTEKTPGGLVSYVVNGRDMNSGHPVTAEANGNGAVTVVRYDLGGQEVPPAALAAVMQKTQDDQRLSGFRPEKTQKIELRALNSEAFAFTGKNAKGQAYEVRVFAETGDVSIIPVAEKAGDASADEAKGKTGKKSGKSKKKS